MPTLSVGSLLKPGNKLSTEDVRRLQITINREVAGHLLSLAVLDNFIAGGKPKFRPNSLMTTFMKKVTGSLGVGKPLVNKGQLYQKAILDPVIVANESEVILRIRRPTAAIRKSAWILHQGGRINIPRTDKMRKFFWAMYFKAKQMGDTSVAEAFQKAALTRKASLIVKIPARPWTKLTSSQEGAIKAETQRAYARAIKTYAETGRLRYTEE